MLELSHAMIHIDRPARLEEIVRSQGFKPIAQDEMDAHMAAELERAPKPKPFARTLNAFFFIAMNVCLFGGVLLVLASVITLHENASRGAPLFFLGAFLITAVFVVDSMIGTRRIILSKARWLTSEISLSDPSSIQLEQMVYARAYEVKAVLENLGISTIAHKHTLMQDSRTLDPVIELVNTFDTSDRVCVAVYDTNTGSFHCA